MSEAALSNNDMGVHMKKANAVFHGSECKLNVNLSTKNGNKRKREINVALVEAGEEKEIFMLSPLGCDQYLNKDSYH